MGINPKTQQKIKISAKTVVKFRVAKAVIGEAGCVGIVLFYAKVRLVVEQTIENMGRIARIRGNHLAVEGRVLVGYMGVEEHARLVAIAQIDLPGLLSGTAGAETLPVRCFGRRERTQIWLPCYPLRSN
jgi:hypothetical protein